VTRPGDRPVLAEQLDLSPHPEGGWYRRTWTSGHPATDLPGRGPRRSASSIYYLLAPGEQSRWHRVGSDEIWLWHHGGPLEIGLGGRADKPGDEHRLVLGDDFAAGHRPQVVVPGGTWQSARPLAGACLVSCVVSPEFHFDDFQMLSDDPDAVGE
jgi:predicted cupin superfamily sugar epimerase